MNPKRKLGWARGAAAIAGLASSVIGGVTSAAVAHDGSGDAARPHYDWSAKPPETVAPAWIVAQATPSRARARTTDAAADAPAPGQAAVFLAFAPRVAVRWDESFLYVESNGLPAHGMMVGITAWQQQVPLPQRYADGNAWLIPLRPEVSANPVSIKGRFLRGAIALAANGIPIFNPQNNRGEVSAEIGELDQWGGHCGRADDYHYHAAPFHLQSAVGQGRPIAYALDGYPIYGLTEPDGSTPEKLDAFHGHERMGLGYHYHGSTRYPYVNGGFHGVVVERDGQVDPQPRAQSPRRDQPPLRGAKITDFSTAPDEKVFSLGYTVNGKPASMSYQATGDGGWIFKFVGADGVAREESFPAGGARPGGGKGGNDRRPPPPPPSRDTDSGARVTAEVPPPHTGAMVLRSPVVGADHVLPVEFTGDGASATPPLEWSGVPAGTKALAVIMHHLDPEGMTKWYWTLYNIPADVTGLSKNTQGIGTLGNNSVNRRVGFAPPHSKGPGEKTYVLTVYALSAPLKIDTAPAETNRAGLLNAMRGLVLDSAELRVTYKRSGAEGAPGRGDKPVRPQGEASP